jgi:hypothetical protein
MERKVLVSLMCHPDRQPAITIPDAVGYEAFVNRTPNYGEAVKLAIRTAVEKRSDLVLADSDGYHPVPEIVRLASAQGDATREYHIIKPYRINIGFQSWAYSQFYSMLRSRVRDVTGGLYRLSWEFMMPLPPLRSKDMTIHVELLKKAGRSVFQYGYVAGENDPANSKRTEHFQLKLLREAVRLG